MKNKGVTILSIITNIILIAILCSFIKINGSIIKEKQIVKEMSETAQVTDLNNQINALNTEHIEYMNYIQTCKAQLASAITEMGVETSENANVDTMVSNIRSLSLTIKTISLCSKYETPSSGITVDFETSSSGDMYVSVSGFNAGSTGYLKIYEVDTNSIVFNLEIPNTSSILNQKISLNQKTNYRMFLSPPDKSKNFYSFNASICYI